MANDLSKTISIIIKVISDAKGALSKTAKDLDAVGKAGKEAASGIGINSSAIAACEQAYENAQKSVRKAKEALSDAGKEGKKAAAEIKKAGSEAGKASPNFDKLAKSAIGIVSLASIGYGVKKVVELADTYTLLDGRLALVTSSTEEAIRVHDELYQVANRSRTLFQATADVYNRFAQAVKGKGVGQEELLGMTETLNKAFVISGASGAEAQAAMVQLSQGFASGALRGEEFNAVIEQGGRVIDMFTDYLKVDRGELRAMAEEGRLTGDVLRNAIAHGAEKVNQEFEKIPHTVGQATTKLTNAFGEVVNGANKSTGATGKVAKAIEDVADMVDQNRDDIIELFTAVVEFAGWAAQRVINLSNSIRGMAAVARGELNFFQYASMDTKEMSAWLKQYDTAAGKIKAQITKTNQEIIKYAAKGVDVTPWENELKGLEAQLKKVDAETALAKAKSEAKAKADKEVAKTTEDVAKKTRLTAKEMKELTGDLLPLVEAQKKYKEQIDQINMAEKAGQFSDDKAKNAELASTARKNAAKELEKVSKAADKNADGANGASKAWKAFGDAIKQAEAEMDLADKALELKGLEKTIELQNKILAKEKASVSVSSGKIALLDAQIAKYKELAASIPESSKSKSADTEYAQLQVKINEMLIERAKLLEDMNNSKLRALSEEKILGLEMQKIEAQKETTAYAQAKRQIALDKQIVEERIRLKQYEIAKIEAMGDNADASDILKAKNELLELNIQLQSVGAEGRKTLAQLRLDEIGESWRQNTKSIEEYRAAVQEAYASGLIKQKEYSELMIKSGDDMSAAFSLGMSEALEQIRTDAELMVEIGNGITNQLASGFSSAFMAAVTGSKNALDAFRDMALGMLDWLAQLIIKQMIFNAVKAMGFGAADGGFIGNDGPTQKLASGGKVAGFSPNDRADNVPIWATAGEFMQPVRAVRYYGLAFMEAIRTMSLPRSEALALVRGFGARSAMPSFRLAMGGPVPNLEAAGAMGGGTSYRGGDTNLKVINVIDKGLMESYVKTAKGETALLNFIKRNGSTIRTIIGG